jgi:hypothetical protein
MNFSWHHLQARDQFSDHEEAPLLVEIKKLEASHRSSLATSQETMRCSMTWSTSRSATRRDLVRVVGHSLDSSWPSRNTVLRETVLDTSLYRRWGADLGGKRHLPTRYLKLEKKRHACRALERILRLTGRNANSWDARQEKRSSATLLTFEERDVEVAGISGVWQTCEEWYAEDEEETSRESADRWKIPRSDRFFCSGKWGFMFLREIRQ